jgi:hypothetical protein
MKKLGHSTLSMTERYEHLAPKNSHRTVATLENFLSRGKDGDVIDINN